MLCHGRAVPVALHHDRSVGVRLDAEGVLLRGVIHDELDPSLAETVLQLFGLPSGDVCLIGDEVVDSVAALFERLHEASRGDGRSDVGAMLVVRDDDEGDSVGDGLPAQKAPEARVTTSNGVRALRWKRAKCCGDAAVRGLCRLASCAEDCASCGCRASRFRGRWRTCCQRSMFGACGAKETTLRAPGLRAPCP